MKKNSTQQEVLLMTGTSFSARQICERENVDSSKFLTENEKDLGGLRWSYWDK